jgi:hypothetical protein
MRTERAFGSRAAVTLGAVGLALLIAAGIPMRHQSLPLWAGAALVAGCGLWILLGFVSPPSADRMDALDAVERGPRLLPLALSVVAGALAWRGTAGGVFRTMGVVPWIACVVLWLWAWRPRASSPPSSPAADPLPRRTVTILFLGLTALGVGLLFYDLAGTPSNPTSDHAETLEDIVDLLKGERPIFFPRNTGREPLKFYWLLFLVRAFGLPLHFQTLKIATAVFGALLIPAVFLLARELRGDGFGLCATALLVISRWHLSMARMGLRVTHAAYPTAFVLWALLRYLRRGDRGSVLWAGIGIGVGLYGYIPFRVVPLLVPLALGIAALDFRRKGRRLALLGDGLLIAATAAVVFLPLLHYMTERGDLFWYRAATRAADTEVRTGPEPMIVFADNVRRMLLAFNWCGTITWVNALEKDPFLDIATGGCFLAGALLAAALVARRSHRWGFLLASIFVLTLPSSLSLAFPLENPSINRSIPVLPVVICLATLPLSYLFERARDGPGSLRTVTAAVVAGILIIALRENFISYFVKFHESCVNLSEPAIEISQAIRSFQGKGVSTDNAYLLSAMYWVDIRNVAYELDDPEWAKTHNVSPNQPPPELAKRPLLFVLKSNDRTRFSALKTMYKQGQEFLFQQPFVDRNFSVYFVPVP